MSQIERPLGGGRSTALVRIGETVRRAGGPWTPTIHAYLRHLEGAGFSGAPAVLGIDEQGREIVQFFPGDTLGDAIDPKEPKTTLAFDRPWPSWMRSDAALAGVGRLYRRLHDAAAGFRPLHPIWREYEFPMHVGEIVCHGDAGPWNVVYRDGLPVALIDWDAARPDHPVNELASAAWTFVPLGSDARHRACGFAPPFEPVRRLRILVDAYGLADRGAILPALSEVRQTWMFKLRYWQPLPPVAAVQLLRGTAEDLEWLDATMTKLGAALK